jgi:hypothetical protein
VLELYHRVLSNDPEKEQTVCVNVHRCALKVFSHAHGAVRAV